MHLRNIIIGLIIVVLLLLFLNTRKRENYVGIADDDLYWRKYPSSPEYIKFATDPMSFKDNSFYWYR